MDVSNRVTQLEDEIKVLKNEMLAVLLDVKENLLTRENPFNQQRAHDSPQIIAFSQQAAPAPEPADQPAAPAQEPVSEAAAAATVSKDEPEYEESYTAEDFDSEDEGLFESPRRFEEKVYPAKAPEMARNDSADDSWVDELVKSWRPLEAGEPKGKAEAHATEPITGTCDNLNSNISLATLSGLAAWVTENSRALGAERVQTIFDISEMMGDIPSELKLTLEKLIPHNSAEAQVDSEQIPAQSYLSALKKLATLLGKENVNDFVVMHMVSHGLNSRRKGV